MDFVGIPTKFGKKYCFAAQDILLIIRIKQPLFKFIHNIQPIIEGSRSFSFSILKSPKGRSLLLFEFFIL